MIYIYKVIAMMLLWFVCSVSVSAAPININGWWGEDENSCNNADNQSRIALGKWKANDSGIQFGTGKEAIGLYEGKCELSNKKASNAKVEYKASCDLDGENYNGKAKITIKDANSITLFFPGGDSEGMNLIRCDVAEKPKEKKEEKEENTTPVIVSKKTNSGYILYKNSEAGFIIDIPQDVLYPQGESDDSKRQDFKSEDGSAILHTAGDDNVENKTIKQLYSDALNPSDKNEKTFTYKRLSSKWFVLSGYHNDNIFYQKTMLSSTGVILSFYFEHPKSEKSFYNDIIVKMSRSFKEL